MESYIFFHIKMLQATKNIDKISFSVYCDELSGPPEFWSYPTKSGN